MLFKRGRKEPLFSSSGWLVRLRGRRDNLCIDSGLAPLISESYRKVLLVYPAEACSSTALSTRKLEGPDVDGVISMIIEGCLEARRIVDELAEKARPSVRGLALLRPASREEVLYTEARNALLLCDHIFGGDPEGAQVEWFRPAYINYVRDGMVWKRLRGLARLEPGIEELVRG